MSNQPISPFFSFAFGIYKALQARNEAELIKKFGEKEIHVKQELMNFFPLRFEEAMSIQRTFSEQLFEWIFNSKEYTNYTVNVTDACLEYMGCFVSAVTGIPFDQSRKYISELVADTSIPKVVAEVLEAHPNESSMDAEVRYGKRLVWYALARTKKPGLIVETGLDKGLGSVVLCLALLKNKAEGFPGMYVGLDISPHAGFLLRPPFTEVGHIIRGDSIESLKGLSGPIDMLICDSDHTPGYERREYETAERKMRKDALILSDTAFYDRCLFDYAQATGRRFLYCPEYAANHWYRGDGVGVAFR